ncbi:hypothetical protein SDC9_144344 [bioreactor metagenome]|uniref:Uncharacterized protein n=1 Tax=bioreactor metagenome TaxID=1076179 RepID=A0A645E6I7_9ZZZZ
MAKIAADILAEWEARGYCSASPVDSDMKKYTSFIGQGRQSILAYCNLPLTMTGLPDGLFYPWVEISYAIMTGSVFEQSSGMVKSIKEGDRSVTYNTEKNGAIAPMVDYSNILNRYRCLF